MYTNWTTSGEVSSLQHGHTSFITFMKYFRYNLANVIRNLTYFKMFKLSSYLTTKDEKAKDLGRT